MSALLAAAPALPLGKSGKFVAAAYIVFVAVILIYITIMAIRAQRLERELDELRRDVEAARRHGGEKPREKEPALAGRLTRPPGVASQLDDAAATRLSEPGRRAGGTAAGERGPA